MPNLFSGINLALRALLARQQVNEGIDPDPDNSGMPAHCHQEVELSPARLSQDPSSHHPGLPAQMGSGVMADQIQRFNLEFVEGRYRYEIGETRRWELQRDILQQVESILAETAHADLIPALDSFWAAWLALSSDPSNLAQRKDLLKQATGIAEALNLLAKSLQAARQSQNQSIEARVEEINSLGVQLACVNAEIGSLEASGSLLDELLVKRSQILIRLSEICGATAGFQEDGEAVVSIGGSVLVAGMTNHLLESHLNVDNQAQATWQEGGQALQASSGELAAMLAARDQIIPELLAGLNFLAFHLTSQVNAIHVSPKEYYSSQIARLRSKKRAAEEQARDHKLVSNSLAILSKSASRVWLDEEAATLVESQQAFQAAARLVTSVDEMMDRIIDGMGTDGS